MPQLEGKVAVNIHTRHTFLDPPIPLYYIAGRRGPGNPGGRRGVPVARDAGEESPGSAGQGAG